MPALISASRSVVDSATGHRPVSAHQLEADVRRALLSSEGVDIASLVVRRLPNGVCLEGIVRVHSDDVDVCKAVRELTGVGEVVNHLVVCWNGPEPVRQSFDEMMF